jgi:tetratricopeptide (TPR) repeat protein
LKEDAILEGTVYQVGDSIQVRFQLTDALPEEQNLWSETYERPMSDVLMMYSEVARVIASEIKIGLTQEEETRFAGARQVNPDSYDAYLKGYQYFNSGIPENTEIAMQYYELALEIDPNNALALVGISSVWHFRYLTGQVQRQEAIPRIKTLLEKALELDNTLALAHSGLAWSRGWYEWDWEGAEKAYQQALKLNPNHADIHVDYSIFLLIMGRPEEALPHMELAIELDPLVPLHYMWYGNVLVANHRYDDAISAFRTAGEMTPNLGLEGIGVAYAAKGMYDEALAIFRRVYADDAEATAALEDGFKKAGYKGAARAVADLLAERHRRGEDIWVLNISGIYVAAGEYELAIDWLEKAYEDQSPSMPMIGMPGRRESLRSYPRFQELLRKMNLPVDVDK